MQKITDEDALSLSIAALHYANDLLREGHSHTAKYYYQLAERIESNQAGAV